MDQENGIPTKRRKRGDGSLQSERKKRRSEGKEYHTKKNLLVKSKQPPKLEVSCKCSYSCREISHDQKLHLFREYYALEDNSKQKSYAMGLIHIGVVRRRRHGKYEEPANSRRQATPSYTLPNVQGDIMQVCRATFMEVFGIGRRQIETLVKHKKAGQIVYKKKGEIILNIANSHLKINNRSNSILIAFQDRKVITLE